MDPKFPRIGRRSVLRIAGVASAAFGSSLGACISAPKCTGDATSDSSIGFPPPSMQPDAATATASSRSSVLLVFFSRAGENYYNGGRINLQVGNTEVAAGMIRDTLACDVYRIQPAEPYSDNYDVTVQRNVREQNDRVRPAIADPLVSLDSYDTILVGSPVWNVRAPRIMLTFAERFDFTGKTVYPFTTYAVSGLGNVVDEYRTACRGATIGEALAVRGEEVSGSRLRIEEWLQGIGLFG